MPLKVRELFGYPPEAPEFPDAIRVRECPFIGYACRKNFSDGMASGLCTASATKDPSPVICCPQRLYADDYAVLRRVSEDAFGSHPMLIDASDPIPDNGAVIPFGQRLGKELKVKARGSSYSFDWILALVDGSGALVEFVAAEVQTIDTTGSYRRQSWELQAQHGGTGIDGYPEPEVGKSSNFNFENVNKRILPQLITKGHLLRLEEKCRKGLFFICPTPILRRILNRLGNELTEYSMQPGSITFHDYTIDEDAGSFPFPLKFGSSFTTTHDQLALAFSSPQNLPPKNSYTRIVQDAVTERLSSSS